MFEFLFYAANDFVKGEVMRNVWKTKVRGSDKKTKVRGSDKFSYFKLISNRMYQ